jgi:hypothetical protein
VRIAARHEAGGIASGSAQAGDEAAAQGIADLHEQDRDGARLLQHDLRDRRGQRQNEIGPQRDQLLGECAHAIHVTRGPAIVELDAAAILPPQTPEPLAESCQHALREGVGLGKWNQDADPTLTLRELRLPDERPRRNRAAEQRDDLAAFPLMEMHPFPQAQGTHPRISEAGPAR